MAKLCFSLQLFGPPRVHRIGPEGDETELVWRLRRALIAVTFLAVQPARRASMDELVEAVLPEASADAVRRNFHPTLTDARRTLIGPRTVGPRTVGLRTERGGVIVFSHGIYMLSPEADWHLDIERYRQRIGEGRALREVSPTRALEAWESAWKLRHGPFLSGGLARELDRTTLAIDAYRSVLLEEPYEEHVHIKLMELYASQGRRDLVRKQYVRLQGHLKEIDVEPLESTQGCYLRLMR